MRAGESANAGADDRDALVALGHRRQGLARRIVSHAEVVAVRRVALQRTNGDGFINLAAAAIVFARMRADPSQHIRKRIGRTRNHVRLFIARDPNCLNVSSALGVNGTGALARDILVEILAVRNSDGVAHASLLVDFECRYRVLA